MRSCADRIFGWSGRRAAVLLATTSVISVALAGGPASAQGAAGFAATDLLQSAAHEHQDGFSAVLIRPFAGEPQRGGGLLRFEPKRVSAESITAQWLVLEAFGIQDFQLAGGPRWVYSDRFRFEATTESPKSRDEMRALLRGALADRFGLKASTSTSPAAVYALVVAPQGSKMRPLVEGDSQEPPRGPQLTMDTMAALVLQLNSFAEAGLLDRPVVDRTGLTGRFDIRLVLGESGGGDGQGLVAPGTAIAPLIEKQLGLKLQRENLPVERVVIKHIEKPRPN